jgi:hypothetical protein
MTIADIKERYAKTYILADDETHKIIKTMKEDIDYLLQIAEDCLVDVRATEQQTARAIAASIVKHYGLDR